MNLLCCCCCSMAPNNRVTRKWELFAGRNRFYCDGVLMSAPHTGVFYLTCILITGTSALFFAFDCPFLATRINPIIPIVGAVLYFFTMSSLLRTTFSDPGVIPRASHDEAAYIEKQIEVPNSLNSPTYRPPPRTKEVLVKGQTVKLKYCFTCKIFRPPRASHCSLCDNCVDRFDHHCPWVGNCVGKRNYRFFYSFLVSLAFLAVFIFSCSVTHLVLLMKTEQEVFEVIKKAPFTVIVVFICFFSIWSVIGLAGFHTYLTTSDQTTNEDLKGSFSSKGGQRSINPYSRGNICLNCCHILCGPMTPSLIDRRGVATDEFILQMQQQHSSPRQPLGDVLSVTHVSSSAMITSQPMLGSISGSGGNGIGGIGELKSRLYDESNPSSSTLEGSEGVYRPRSYDNLQNGNSNSLAQLVDNEIPLSQMDIPQTQNTANQQRQFRHHKQRLQQNTAVAGEDGDVVSYMANDVDDDEVVVVNNTEVVAAVAAIAATNKARERHNLSDSYNNLFNVEYNSAATTPLADAQHQASAERFFNASGNNLLAAAMGVVAGDAPSNSYDQQFMTKSISQTENMYSNVPNVAATPAVPAGADATKTADTDLHVYSNLIDEHLDKCTPAPKQVADAAIVLSSTLLSDDLDLDDPMSASLVANAARKYGAGNGTHSISKRHSNQNKRKSGVDAVIAQVTNGANAHAGGSMPPVATIDGKTNASAVAAANDLTPSRLRALHDTTMIDTALDLDSLDGSSLGNNSQACLMKPPPIV